MQRRDEGERVSFSKHVTTDGVTDYWAECLLCDWS